MRDLESTVSGTPTRGPPHRAAAVRTASIAQEVVDLVTAAADGEDALLPLEIVCTWPDGQVLSVDPSQVRQVLLNIVQNALAMVDAENGTVAISIAQNPTNTARCGIAVHDNGPGVSPADRERIFTPFWTGRDDGTGLSLPVAQSLVELHGGTLTVRDSDLLGGACFIVSLPVPSGFPHRF